MHTSAIISSDQALQLINEQKVILLDATIDKVNQKMDPTQLELLPNSRFFDIEGAFSDHSNPFPHSMPSADAFQREARKIGIDQDAVLIIYDRWGTYSSPRAWWMFCLMGHPQVYVLQGGMPAWKAAGLPLSDQYSNPEEINPGDFTAQPQEEWMIDKAGLLALLNDKAVRIIDARSAGRFEGTAPEPRPGLRSGHIPGSKNIPFDTVMDGITYKDPEELEKIYAGKASEDKRNIFTCGSGVSAAILALGAYELGMQHITVYDGSWSEWAADPNTPIDKK